MFNPQDDSNGEVKRDQVLQSVLAYWRTAAPLIAVVDPFAWEAGNPVPVTGGRWGLVVLAIIIVLVLLVIVL